MSDWCQCLKSPVVKVHWVRAKDGFKDARLRYRLQDSIPLSLNLSALFFPLLGRLSSHGGPSTSRLISYISATSVSLSNTLPKSQGKALLVHLGHKAILEPVTVAIGWLVKPRLGSEEEEESSTQTTWQAWARNASPPEKQGINLQEEELYQEGKTNNSH